MISTHNMREMESSNHVRRTIMGGRQTFARINMLLEEAGHPARIDSLSELKAFLNDKNNRKLPVYDQVEELYDIILVGQGMW